VFGARAGRQATIIEQQQLSFPQELAMASNLPQSVFRKSVSSFRPLFTATLLVVAAVILLMSNASVAQPALTGVDKLSGGSCVVTTAGAVKCWPFTNISVDGTEDVIGGSPTAQPVPGLSSGISAVASGFGNHKCVVTATGGAKCWGNNTYGQLGGSDTSRVGISGPMAYQPNATDVVGLASGVKAVAVGDEFTCALTTAGGVKCWGRNLWGMLGNNSTTNSIIPVDVTGLTSGVTAISAGIAHACALTAGGGAKCWGENQGSQLGDGTSNNNSLTPVDVFGLSTGVTAISAGQRHSCALTTGGGVKCWGFNVYGQIGDGTSGVDQMLRPIPVDVFGLSTGVTAISLGSWHTCALTVGGGVKCWGLNEYGQLGDNSTATGRARPVDVVGLTSGVKAVAAGWTHTCAATTSGGVKCWGQGSRLGDYAGTDRSAVPLPVDVLAPIIPAHIRYDLNGDGKANLIVNINNGPGPQIAVGSPYVSLTSPSSGYSVKHVADFNGDGKDDLIFENTDGRIAILLMNGSVVTSAVYLVGAGGAWKVAQTGDFNGDGKADVLLRHTDGSLYLALMNGTTVASGAYLTSGNAWTAQAVADLNGDGKADVILKYTDGSLYGLIMNGTTVTSGAFITGGNAWSLQYTGDFDGDGKADILLRNLDGSTAVILMNGTSVTSAGYLTSAGAPWTAVGVGDFNGDGKTDVMLQNADGSLVTILIDGTAVTSANYITTGRFFNLSGIADFNGDGQADIVLVGVGGSYVGQTYVVPIYGNRAGVAQKVLDANGSVTLP
jgi:alpha-tubulin suppressor-like RCC1 family protein